MKLAELASVMSYRDASREFETATGVHVPTRTIHSFVKEIAPHWNLSAINSSTNGVLDSGISGVFASRI